MITRHPCLSITPILIDTILWWCIACPFKGYCQQMLGINTVLICHKPQEKHGKQASMKGLRTGQRENSELRRVTSFVPLLLPTQAVDLNYLFRMWALYHGGAQHSALGLRPAPVSLAHHGRWDRRLRGHNLTFVVTGYQDQEATGVLWRQGLSESEEVYMVGSLTLSVSSIHLLIGKVLVGGKMKIKGTSFFFFRCL